VTTVTSDKAHKTAIRARMAETGEPYNVARRATDAGDSPDDSAANTGSESYEDRYLREAQEAGVHGPELEAMRALRQAQRLTTELRMAAERARERADEAEEAAAKAEERAELAQESAEMMQEWADHLEQLQRGAKVINFRTA